MLKDTNYYFANFSDKRVKERSVDDALYRVREWRRIYEEGISKDSNKKPRITLEEAAKQVKIPKKTLEDYIQIFNKVSLICPIEDFSNKKMGTLRTFIRKNKSKIKKAAQMKRQNKYDSIDVKSEDVKSEESNNVKSEESFLHHVKNQFEYSKTNDIKEENQIDIKIEEQSEAYSSQYQF